MCNKDQMNITLDTSNLSKALTAVVAGVQSPRTANGKPKEKRRNNEKRKEKSRDAARCRRSRETEIFSELGQVLPLSKEDVEQLDKASIMRLAIAYLKIRDALNFFPDLKYGVDSPDSGDTNNNAVEVPKSDEKDQKEEKLIDSWKVEEANKLLAQSMDGFLVILSNEGDFTYVSENIVEYLGISKIDLLGQQIWDYIHQCDHQELREALNIKKKNLIEKVKEEKSIEEGVTTDHRDLFLRFKCTLTSRGRTVNIKSATYKVIHMTGHVVVNTKGDLVLSAIGRPIPHPSNIEIPLGSTTFLTKHSLDMKFTYVDDKMASLFNYKPEDLLGTSLYECHHGGDSDTLMATFKSVLNKGQGETSRYRFLGKRGGYCWVVTQATIVYDKQKPQSVVCVNYVISNLENDHEIYSLAQYEASQSESKSQSKIDDTSDISCQDSRDNSQQPTIIPDDSETKPKPKPNPKPNTCTTQLDIQNHQPQQPQQQHQQQQEKNLQKQEKEQNKLEINLETKLPPEISNKPCVDGAEETSTSAAGLQSKSNNVTPSPSDKIRIISSYISRLASAQAKKIQSGANRGLIYQRDLNDRFAKAPTAVNSSKFVEEKRPKSVTASVFRVTNEKPPLLFGQNNQNNPNIGQYTITLNQTILPQLNIAPSAQSVTASVFTPISQVRKFNQTQQSLTTNSNRQRPVEMNKGYLSLVHVPASPAMLKEEPDDLGQLAPTAVDACLPLDESTPFFGEMLAGLYGGLLPEDINSLDSQGNDNQAGTNKGHIDPFISYRDESNDTNCSQHLLSPSVASKSPGASSLPSLCSPNSLNQDDDFTFMTMNVDDEIDLTMRAPYIPMNEQDDLPLLTDDLMWSVGFTSDDLGIHKDDTIQYNPIKQQINLSTNNNNNNNCNTTNFTNSSPLASPMSSSSAASSPSPCSSNSSISMHNQRSINFSEAILCNTGGGGAGGGGDGDGGGGSNSDGITGSNSTLNVDDSDSGISSINSMSPQHTHPQQQRHHQHHPPPSHQIQQQQEQQHNHQHQHQHQPPQTRQRSSMAIGGLGLMGCKKEIDGDNLCESIDTFESVYSKDSTNLDCWTVQELLNISSNDSNIAIDELQQPQKNDAIIMNSTALPPTTLHVPIITIQGTKNLSLNERQHLSSSPPMKAIGGKAITNNVLPLSSASSSSSSSVPPLSTLSPSLPASNCSKQCIDSALIIGDEVVQSNRKLTGKGPTSITMGLRNSNGSTNTGRQQISHKAIIFQTANLAALQVNNNKRHLASGGTSSLDPKRLKNCSSVEIQTTPNLLQQLMAPVPQKERAVVKSETGYDKSESSSWTTDSGGGGLNNQQHDQVLYYQQQQDANQLLATASSSNSVLKNLLISGCDNLAVKTCPEIMITDDLQINSVGQLSPVDNFKTLDCGAVSPGKVMLNYHSNPMIGGTLFLPSPPLLSDDSSPPGLLSLSDSETSNDSGIDDDTMKKTFINDTINFVTATNGIPYSQLKNSLDPLKPGDTFIANINQRPNESPPIGCHSTTTPLMQHQGFSPGGLQCESPTGQANDVNPLMTTYLMDLCNDDYNMNESDFLEDNDLVQTLSEFSNDIQLSDDNA